MNSLQDISQELEIKLSEIRLSINSDKVFILLEGKTDIKLFRNIFSYSYTDTTELKGKSKLKTALDILTSEGYLNIIGIKDADFDHLETPNYPNNLFMTDYHDMEVQMIESNAFNSVINEYAISDIYPTLITNLNNIIYNIAISIGYIRWFNEKEYERVGSRVLNFNGLNFNNFITIQRANLIFDIDNFLDTLLSHSNNTSLTTQNLKYEITRLQNISTDKLQVSTGHDLAKLISMLFSIIENSDKINVNQNKIEEALRLSYTIEYFKNTNLFQNLNNWANSNNYQLFEEIHN